MPSNGRAGPDDSSPARSRRQRTESRFSPRNEQGMIAAFSVMRREGAVTAIRSIQLVRLAPECEGDLARALRYSDHLATILNTDPGLPISVRRAEGAPFITDEGFLSYTQSWCRQKSALSFAVVDQDDRAIGLITLSHIDTIKGTARTGIILSSRHTGRGIGADAFSQLLSIARSLGVREVGGDIPEAEHATPDLWARSGATLKFGQGELTATLCMSA